MKKTLAAGLLGLQAMASPVLAQSTETKTAAAETTAAETSALETITVFAEVEPYFEKETSTALKADVNEDKVPFTTNVLNSQVIEDLKADRLEKVFEYIPGFSRSGTNANSFTIRGQSADLQNLQVDGLPGLTSRFGSPTTANIERVEVQKGPASVLYGWMDPGGMVNMITKKPLEEEIREVSVSGQVFPEYGATGYTGSVDVTGRANQSGTVLYRMIAGYESEDSFRDHVDDDRAMYLFPSLSWVPDDTRRLDIQYEYTKEDRSADDGLFVLNNDINQRADISTYYQEPGDTDKDEGHAVNVAYSQGLSDTVDLNLKWRSVWHTDERDLYENNSVRSDDTLRRRNRHQYNEREYHFADANLNIDLDAVARQQLVVGVNGGYEYRQYDRLAFGATGANVGLIDPVYTGQVLDSNAGTFRKWDLYNIGAYAQDLVSVTDKLSLLFGARYDTQTGDYNLRDADGTSTQDESATVHNTSFNGGITYQVHPVAAVYASVAQSFNPQAIPTFDASGQQLDPEEGIQYEAGVKFSFLDDRLNANLAVYDLTKENISETVDGARALVGTIESQGAEVSLQYQPSFNWQFQAAYAYTEAEVAETTNDDALGNVPGFVPRHSASLLARYNHPDEVLGGLVGMGLGWRFQSSRYTDEETSKRVKLPSYHVADVNFYYELDSLKLSLALENIFDETYFIGGTNDTEIYAGDPRKISLKAKYVF
ncbi:TonB-dependent receptor [Nisaea acidiphila]|uniref:TonB-dependent receptor n=1 Tax=Nisaea acidiphila TaxID=1862145 RepID=A0A9J7AXS0_9PROT|nr:TonB-dependent receptor [Nisaea acidiphila]UUX51602.1 TonB-dependent receptor [Nisaea acidiphila]